MLSRVASLIFFFDSRVGCYVLFLCLLLLVVLFRFAFRLVRLTLEAQPCRYNLSAIVNKIVSELPMGFYRAFARCMGFPWASALILFHSSCGVCLVSRDHRHCFEKSRIGCWYSIFRSDGVVFTMWV